MQYITFETSKLLVECLKSMKITHLWNSGTSFYDSVGSPRYTLHGYAESLRQSEYPHIPQPELFDWLLERNIFVEVKPIDGWYFWTYTVLLDGRPLHPFIEVKPTESVEFSTYYDAMEAGLQVALINLKQ